MDARLDPNYLRLYQQYARAIRAYENALAGRRRLRAAWTARHREGPRERRPVGAPRGYRGGGGSAAAVAARPATAMKVYLGPILGWVTLTGAAGSEPGAEPGFDAAGAHDALSVKLYWDRKLEYERARRAFFDYVRGREIATHLARARAELTHTANLQLLGADDASEDGLANARAEVEIACRNAWAIYDTAPEPKSAAAKLRLLSGLADAQLVGLDSDVAQRMAHEVQRLLAAGALSPGG